MSKASVKTSPGPVDGRELPPQPAPGKTGSPHASGPVRVAGAIGKASVLDPLTRTVDAASARLGRWRADGSVLRGGGLGHPLHPALTDLPLGLWSAASLLDVVGGPGTRNARTVLVAAGLVSAVPTLATGLADWTSLDEEGRRIGLVHSAGMAAGSLLYARSLAARVSGKHLAGALSAAAGAAVCAASGYLGGHLALGGDTADGSDDTPS